MYIQAQLKLFLDLHQFIIYRELHDFKWNMRLPFPVASVTRTRNCECESRGFQQRKIGKPKEKISERIKEGSVSKRGKRRKREKNKRAKHKGQTGEGQKSDRREWELGNAVGIASVVGLMER